MTNNKFRRLHRFPLAAICATVWLSGQMVVAQGDIQSLVERCRGPQGAQIPECQAARYMNELPAQTQATPSYSHQQSSEEARPAAPQPPSDPLAPEPPTEFQRFIASSVGRVLPIFGTELFHNVPTTFAPLDRVPVTADYVIGPGDEIILRVWGQVSMDLKLQVDRSGSVYIPQVGNVNVSGIQFRQLSDYMRSQLGRVFRNFDLSVNMGQLRSIQIFVMGHARRPGTYTVSSLSTLVNALFASGGPSAEGSMRRIQLKRGAEIVTELDLYDMLLRGDKSADARLLPEDVVYIPSVGPQVAAAGSVKNPAVYELKEEKTVKELLQMTGGLSPIANRQHAKLERIRHGLSREVLDLQLGSDGINTVLADGDVLQVLSIVPRFDDTVTLRGNVANPGRFSWHEGMRLRDIIPDRESLITRDYWKKKNALGSVPFYVTEREALISKDSPAKKELAAMSPLEVTEAELAAELKKKPAEIRIESDIPDINWSYAVIERQNPKDLRSELVPFHLGKLVLENDDRQNLELRSGDTVTIFSQADIRVPQVQQTRFVRLEGEFNAPGIYTVEPGETLGSLIKRAGGLTQQAYLFGSEFLRKSVQSDQQKRLDQYVEDLEQEVEVAAGDRLANTVSVEDSARLTSEIQTQRQLVQRLRSVESTGRIVLSLQPDSNDISKIAGLTLEDGDRFVVPSRLATVSVIGAVYNPNSFMHITNGEVSEYLKQAGGFTRSADKDRLYIIRADGSVLPKQNTSHFAKTRLNPGDSIVVPEQVLKTTFMQGLRNWSQIIGQFGLGAAAINVLR